MNQAIAPSGSTFLLREYDVIAEVRVLRLQVLEKRLKVEVALAAHAEVKRHRGLVPALEKRAEDRLDRRQAAAARHQQHRTAVGFPQVRDAERSRDFDAVADLERGGYVGACTTARHMADVEG